ncbi:unnamed protein product [Prorocentrum cordatum]|uniref:Uncharacterized protein n=1 Tax=Prorocentrum cordatum TaxID=2364126 RepID=A0ABN9T4B4_9DINO|nr:unnamed protein product [Polarella glacialis]
MTQEDGRKSVMFGWLWQLRPFCPFRSAFCADGGVNAEMGELSERAAVTFREFAPVSLEIQMGKVPDPKVVKPFLEKLSETNELWKVALGRMRLSEDFQAAAGAPQRSTRRRQAASELRWLCPQFCHASLLNWRFSGAHSCAQALHVRF